MVSHPGVAPIAAVEATVPRGRAPGAVLVTVAVLGAALLRAVVGGRDAASSAAAAVMFAAVLLAIRAWAGGVPPAHGATPPRGRAVALGVAGGAALVALSLLGVPAILLGPRAAVSSLLWWMPLVSVLAVSEELVLRGVLFDTVRARWGEVAAVALTALVFAVMHLPLYGVRALGIDLAAGVFLGMLRVISGGVTAPAIAHVLADLPAGWMT